MKRVKQGGPQSIMNSYQDSQLDKESNIINKSIDQVAHSEMFDQQASNQDNRSQVESIPDDLLVQDS